MCFFAKVIEAVFFCNQIAKNSIYIGQMMIIIAKMCIFGIEKKIFFAFGKIIFLYDVADECHF